MGLPDLSKREGTSKQWLPDLLRYQEYGGATFTKRTRFEGERILGKKKALEGEESKESKRRMGKSGREGKLSPFISPRIIKSMSLDHI